MKRIFLPMLLLAISGLKVLAQDLSLYEKHSLIKNTDTLPYRLLLPENYDTHKKYPLIFFMHGAGERGNDNEAQLIHGAKLFLQPGVRQAYPAIIVFPQCAKNSFWSSVKFTNENGKREFLFDKNASPTISMQLANDLLHQLIKQYPVQKKQIYIGGLSMGGMGTFELVYRNPKLFAAAMPICGGGDPAIARDVRKTDWWVFHGAKDDVVPPAFSDKMVAALRAVKASVKYSLYPNANHNSWDAAFAEPGLLSWLFAQKR